MEQCRRINRLGEEELRSTIACQVDGTVKVGGTKYDRHLPTGDRWQAPDKLSAFYRRHPYTREHQIKLFRGGKSQGIGAANGFPNIVAALRKEVRQTVPILQVVVNDQYFRHAA
jgi:hypothetical protein